MAHLIYGPELAFAIQSLQYSTFVDISAFSILIYDYSITLSEEIELIWPMSPASIPKILFLLTRYLPFVDMTVCMLQHFGHNFSPEFCKWSAVTVGWFIATGLLLSEALLTLRTWAVWERGRTMGVGLFVWFIAIWIPALFITGVFLESLVYGTLPHPVAGCWAISGNFIDFVDWLLLMIYDAGMLLLISIKAVLNFKVHGRSALYKAVYWDGSLFYLYLSVLSALNVVLILTLPDGRKQILPSFERVIHSVLTCRLVLSLREITRRPIALENCEQSRPPIPGYTE